MIYLFLQRNFWIIIRVNNFFCIIIYKNFFYIIFIYTACEAELRQLRKATSDYEAQNAVLQRHVDSLYAAVNRLESETNQQRTTNQALQRHLDSLRSQLAGCFATISLPG